MLRMAYKHAMINSTDPSTQNGAIIVANGALSFGANHFPKGVQEKEDRWVRPLKYSYVEHAERNAVYAAAKNGIKTEGGIMYCPWFACSDCARAIIQAGISEVIGHKHPAQENVPNWKNTIEIAMGMLNEAGVKWTNIDATFGDVEIRFNGSVIKL